MLYAEDIIVIRNGDIITGIVQEISSTEVKYKKSSNPNGPLYVLDKTNILSIKYKNGETEIFDLSSIKSPKIQIESNLGLIELQSSAENDSILSLYTSCKWERLKEAKGKVKFRNSDTYWGVAKGSILCDSDFEVTFESDMIYIGDYHPYSNRIRIHNRTDNPLYIDLANSFRIDNSNATPFYDPNSYSSGNNSKGGVSLGLGAISNILGIGGIVGTLSNGIGVTKGGGTSASVTYNMERILIVPPHSSALMPGKKCLYGKEIISYYEKIPALGAILQDNDEVYYSEDDNVASNSKLGYYITYSKIPDFSSYHIIPIKFFAWRLSTGKWKIIKGGNWRLIKGGTFDWNHGSFVNDENWNYKNNEPN